MPASARLADLPDLADRRASATSRWTTVPTGDLVSVLRRRPAALVTVAPALGPAETEVGQLAAFQPFGHLVV
jgi:hypothetical protein